MVKRKRKRVSNYSSESDGVSDTDWDDKHYLDFLNQFPIDPTPNNNIDDDEADPEYHVEEDDDHDIEDLRWGSRLEISQEELAELLAEAGKLVNQELGNNAVDVASKQDQSVQVVLDESNFHNHTSVQVVEEQQQQQQQVQVEEEQILFSDRVTGIIKYQMQQHLQLLAQTYVLTATESDDESLKNLAKESKAMIMELNNLSDVNGPKSNFAVKNIHHAKDLINTWPINGTCKSPIKKKILAESYVNENKIEEDDFTIFPRNTVKVLSESAVFMYSELLPLSRFLRTNWKMNFTVNEDYLIVSGLHDMDMDQETYECLSLHKKAELIKNFVLAGRSVDQIFHRIKNARKSCTKEISSANSILRQYFIEKTLPSSPTSNWTPSLLDLEPIPPTQQPNLSVEWCALIKKFRSERTFKDYFAEQSTLKKSHQMTQKEKRPTKGKKQLISNNSTCDNSDSPTESSSMIESNPSLKFVETERIPVLDMHGKPTAYIIVIPKFCTNSTQSLKNRTTTNSDTNNPSEPLHNNNNEKNSNDNNAKTSQVVEIPRNIPFSMSLDSVECDPTSDVCSSASPLRIFQKETSSTSSSTPSPSAKIRKNRKDHSARTWVYVRKSLTESAASIAMSLENELNPTNHNDDIEEANANYNTEMHKPFDDTDSEVDTGQTAFAEEFWLKVQHTVDPVVYDSFVQIFIGFGDQRVTEEELFVKVGDMLNNYPDLLLDFVTIVDPESPETYNFFKDNYFKKNGQGQVQIQFICLLEKLTMEFPQLKARVVQKLRYLWGMDKLRESDVMNVVNLYFEGNSVMTEAFKALFPTLFQPEKLHNLRLRRVKSSRL